MDLVGWQPSASWVLTALVAALLAGCAEERREQRFSNFAANHRTFSLRELFDGESYCILPGGEFPRPYVIDRFHNFSYSEERSHDSQEDWFIVIVSQKRKTAKVVPIQYESFQLENLSPVCSTKLRISVSTQKRILAIDGVD